MKKMKMNLEIILLEMKKMLRVYLNRFDEKKSLIMRISNQILMKIFVQDCLILWMISE
jgi:hypothetical protein